MCRCTRISGARSDAPASPGGPKMKSINLDEIVVPLMLTRSIPVDLAIWLIYRRILGNCPTLKDIAAIEGLGVGPVENFFCRKFGIRNLVTPGKSLRQLLTEVFAMFGKELPNDRTIDLAIAKYEAKYVGYTRPKTGPKPK